MEGFTSVNLRRRKAADTAPMISDVRVPGALWTDVPLSRCHLPGIPYSYYDDEIVMIRQRTAELIARQSAELRAQARAQRRHHHVHAGGQWYTLEHGHAQRAGAGAGEAVQWQGVDE